jgi:hypothetical protein
MEGDSHFHVLLTNVSTAPVTLFEEWNSWGYYGLSFDITYADGHKVHTYKTAREWQANYPSTITLAPKGFYVFDVNFDTTWANSIRLHPAKVQQGLECRLRAIYSIAPNKSKKGRLPSILELLDSSPWTGTVRSVEMPCIVYK